MGVMVGVGSVHTMSKCRTRPSVVRGGAGQAPRSSGGLKRQCGLQPQAWVKSRPWTQQGTDECVRPSLHLHRFGARKPTSTSCTSHPQLWNRLIAGMHDAVQSPLLSPFVTILVDTKTQPARTCQYGPYGNPYLHVRHQPGHQALPNHLALRRPPQ